MEEILRYSLQLSSFVVQGNLVNGTHEVQMGPMGDDPSAIGFASSLTFSIGLSLSGVVK